MNRSRLRKPLMLFAFLTACVVCVLGIVSTASRLNLEVKSFEKGDALLSIWNIPIESEQHRLFLFRLIDANRIEPVTVERIREQKVYRVTFDGDAQEVIPTVVRDTLMLSLSVPTVKRFGGLYLLGVGVVCAMFLFAAFFVERKSPSDDKTHAFTLAALLFSVMIATAQTRFEAQPLSLANALHAAFLFSYAIAPVCFFRWSVHFPKPTPRRLSSVALFLRAYLLRRCGLALRTA